MAGAEHVGREQTVEALGRTWKVSRWTRNTWDEYTAWAASKLPDPLAVVEESLERMMARAEAAHRRGLSERAKDSPPPPAFAISAQWKEMAERLLQTAFDQSTCYLAVNSPQMMSILNSPGGGVHMLWLLLREHQPGVTEDEAHDLHTALSGEAMGELFAVAQGRVPAGNAGGRSGQ